MAAHVLMSRAEPTGVAVADNREPLHTFRAPTPLWTSAQEVALANGESLSEVLRRALEQYVQAGTRVEHRA